MGLGCKKKIAVGYRPVRKVEPSKLKWDDMTKVPADEKELLTLPIFMTMHETTPVDDWLTPQMIKSKALATIWLEDEEKAIQVIDQLQRESKWDRGFQFDLLCCFWLSVHCECLSVLNQLINFDIYLRQLCTLAMAEKPERPRGFRSQKQKEKTDKNKVTQLLQDAKGDVGAQNGMTPRKNNSARRGSTSSRNRDTLAGGETEMVGSGLASGLISQDQTANYEGGEAEQNAPSEFMSQQTDENDLGLGNSPPAVGGGGRRGKGANDSNSTFTDSGEYSDGESQSDSSGSSTVSSKKSLEWKKPVINSLNFLVDKSTISSCDEDNEINLGAPDDSQNPFIFENEIVTPAPIVKMNNKSHEAYLEEAQVSGLDIELTQFKTIEDIQRLKTNLRLRFPVFMANIIKILLFRGEQNLACFLTAYYEISLDPQMLVNAVENKHYQWLNYVWAFGKNYIGVRRMASSEYLSILQLLEIIRKQCQTEKRIKENMEIVCRWYMLGDDDDHNILFALLSHYQELLCLQYMGYYSRFLDKALFVFALEKGNSTFMQQSMALQAFDKQIYKDSMVIKSMLTFFQTDGSKTNFILNVLLSSDITLWKNQYLVELIGLFENYIDSDYQDNRLLLSYNPMMSIALTADLLTKIAESRKIFKDQCLGMLDDLLNLGKVYNAKIEDEVYYESLIMDKDFNGRTVLKIICQKKFQPLMSEEDPKAENIIRNIWYGKESTRCDGNIYGYSNLTHILFSRARKADAATTFFDIISHHFKPNFMVDYTMQHRYRKMSIQSFFVKEIFFAFVMVLQFQNINRDYLAFFHGVFVYLKKSIDSSTGLEKVIITEQQGMYDFDRQSQDISVPITEKDEKVEYIDDRLEEYRAYYNTVFFLSGSLMYQVSTRLLFNSCNKGGNDKKVPYDLWTILDIISSICTLTVFLIVVRSTPEQILDTAYKQNLDYMVMVLNMIQYFRFFSFFLMISEMSKMILTFIAMVRDTISFMYLVFGYLFLMACVFTTMFQDVNPGSYKDFPTSLRSMFDGLMASYGYKGYGEYEIEHMVFIILHVYMSNILLLNYLIAILSTSYVSMLESGVFLYKVNLFQYCERYMVANQNVAYGQLVTHPSPLVLLNIPLFILTAIPGMPKWFLEPFSEKFSIFMFWLDNIVILGLFLLFEILLIPFVYIKNILTVVVNTSGLFTTIFYTARWIFLGPFYSLFLLLRDFIYFFKILTMLRGCRAAADLADELYTEPIDEDLEVRLYNEAREIVIEHYFEVKKELDPDRLSKEAAADDENKIDFINLDILKLLEEDEELILENREKFIVKWSTLHDDWKKKKSKIIRQAQEKELEGDVPDKNNEISQAEIEAKAQQEAQEKAEAEKRANSKKGQLRRELVSKKGGTSEQIIAEMINIQGVEEQKDGDDEEEESEEEQEDLLLNADDMEDQLVETFYKKFIIGSESAFNDNIDITLFLKAIPTQIYKDLNLNMIRKFNFLILQNAYVAFKNEDKVDSFEFYDSFNKTRVLTIRGLILAQKENLTKVDTIMRTVKEKIQKNEKILMQRCTCQDMAAGQNDQDMESEEY